MGLGLKAIELTVRGRGSGVTLPPTYSGMLPAVPRLYDDSSPPPRVRLDLWQGGRRKPELCTSRGARTPLTATGLQDQTSMTANIASKAGTITGTPWCHGVRIQRLWFDVGPRRGTRTTTTLPLSAWPHVLCLRNHNHGSVQFCVDWSLTLRQSMGLADGRLLVLGCSGTLSTLAAGSLVRPAAKDGKPAGCFT